MKTPRVLAINVETTGGNPRHGARPYSLAACDTKGNRYHWCWPVDPISRRVTYSIRDLKEIDTLSNQYKRFVFHNSKFDNRHIIAMLTDTEGYGDEEIDWSRIDDTLLMSHVLDSSESHNLQDLALKYLDILDDDKEQVHKETVAVKRKCRKLGWNLSTHWEEDAWVLKAYDKNSKTLEIFNLLQAERTIRLYLLFKEALRIEKLEAHYERERSLLPIIYQMESHGVSIHLPTLHNKLKAFQTIAKAAEVSVGRVASRRGITDFNIRSGPKLADLLHNHLGFPVLATTPNGTPKTDEDTLKALADLNHNTHLPTVKLVLKNRKAESAIRYLHQYQALAIPYDQKYATLHPGFNQTGTHTTRFSSTNPNAQNISTQEELPLRAIFGPPPGFFWLDADYSAIELRLFAYLAQEKSLIDSFKRGESPHYTICQLLHNWKPTNENETKDRRYKSTKNGNFALIYGAGESRADSTYGVPGAYQRIRNYFPGLAAIQDKCSREIKDNGYVTTLFGYRLYCPADRSYTGLNYKIQGTAGDIIKNAMLNLSKSFSPEVCQIVLTVHDELVFQIPKGKYCVKSIFKQIKHDMEEPGDRIGIPCPVTISIVEKFWDKRKAINI